LLVEGGKGGEVDFFNRVDQKNVSLKERERSSRTLSITEEKRRGGGGEGVFALSEGRFTHHEKMKRTNKPGQEGDVPQKIKTRREATDHLLEKKILFHQRT